MKDLTILMPCLNEARTIAQCIKRAQILLEESGLNGEILVSDNGSTDNSLKIALRAGARTTKCLEQGYGAALQNGLNHAHGRFVLIGDSDDSYHFDEALPMIHSLQEGYDICMGTRLKGRIMPGAMPFLNRYLGNPILSLIGKLLFRINISDFHCGMRAFRKDRILALNLVTTGMEWASEMLIKAKLSGLKTTEVPVTLYKDGRDRAPHLRPWRDGWRHLRFMLLHSPNYTFIFPGLALMGVGLLGVILLPQGVLTIATVRFDIHSLLVASFMLVLGLQMAFTGIFAKLYSHISGFLPYDEHFNRSIRRFTLEKLLVISLLIGSIGFIGCSSILIRWVMDGFPEFNYQITLRSLIPFLVMAVVSIQGIFNGFMLSIIFLKPVESRNDAIKE